jgi:hypothetical protein
MRDNGRRFRFNTIISRYNQLRELWGRKMREREEGPLDFRRRQAAMTAPSPAARTESGPVTSAPAEPYVRMAPETNGEELRRLHEEIERHHQTLGKPSGISLEQLAGMVRKQAELVRSKYHVTNVAFRVELVDGKVKLKAKPIQD